MDESPERVDPTELARIRNIDSQWFAAGAQRRQLTERTLGR
jgi:hypothetical protein